MKNKFMNVFKRIQSYSFLIFIALILVAFFIIARFTGKNVDLTPTDIPVDNTDPNENPGEVIDYENETLILPLIGESEITRYFHSATLDKADQIRAFFQTVSGIGRFSKSVGVSYTVDFETEFDVIAALSGKVIEVGVDTYFGKYVIIEHVNGYKTEYYGLAEVNVKENDNIEQKDVIGVAGTNRDSESGIHVHFRILDEEDFFINPTSVIGKKVKDFS